MSTSGRRVAGGGEILRTAAALALPLALALPGLPQVARAAGIEHPDIGTIAIGRGGAYAAAPTDGMALQYNPAGFAHQTGLRLTAAGDLSWQGLSFAPAGGGPSVSNQAGVFLVPGGAVSYGLGRIGPLSGLTFALGATGPSAIGKERYPDQGAQRYALIQSDYFIGYYAGAVAASLGDWLSAGVTVQLVKGTARFSQAVWTGSAAGTDPGNDAVAHIDVASPFIPTAVFGVSARPIPRLALGLSYRPRFDFLAHGSLTTTGLSNAAQAADVQQVGDRTDFFVPFPDVIRLGAQYEFGPRWLVEADVVAELWSRLSTIEIRPRDIQIRSGAFDISKPLPNIVFQKDFQDSASLRVGADYVLLPGRLTVRGGYLYETSAIPSRSVSVDFGNWQRHALSAGASVTLVSGLAIDLAYAHHFMPTQTVTSSQVVQVVTPCVTPGCTEPPPTVVGNGVYDGSLDVLSFSLRVSLDDLRGGP
jgi:long-subunit fatty acid transport protein